MKEMVIVVFFLVEQNTNTHIKFLTLVYKVAKN